MHQNKVDRLLALIKELLSDNGSVLVHLDDSVASHVKIILDELFDADNFRSQVIWQRVTSHSDRRGFAFNYDVIFHYTKSQNFVWNPQYQAYDEAYLKSHYRSIDKDGRRYELDNVSAAGAGEPRIFFGKLIAPPPGTHWRWSQERIDKLIAENRIELTKNGTPRYKRYLDEMPGKAVQAIWTDIPPVNSQAHQDTGYDTQKPEGLLERIIQALSNEGDLVADFFCGSGTTGAVAEQLGRRWIMCDLGRFAIHTTRKRMIELQRKLHSEGKPYRAFDVYNLGRYERQWWQKDRLQGADEEHRRVILEFFKAEVLTNPPSPLLHGRKAGAFCHVDGIDSIFTREEAKQVAQATAQAGGRECYCLAWEFEMDLHLLVNALTQELGVKLKLVQIPREIMEKNRKSPPPFLEVAVLAAEPVYRKATTEVVTTNQVRSEDFSPQTRKATTEVVTTNKARSEDFSPQTRTVDIKLTQFLPSLAEVPTKELEAIKERAIKSGFDFIDFWAIDFNWQPGKPFTHDWQDYRTRKDRSLKTISDAGYTYPASGKYTACVKVVDIFGCDTSITVEVEV
ncbi:site-specific DNA-methyltransferase [Leptothermofonsia sichuanensis E412]|uniref:site-specific DNA-methyltransferase n=1 Tax=Leptothermofonsia sichuanensis TaxID=2917832 RepID=UPI001CA607EA|nr:site-specific DNA-methyltransferase [Leptothermofonsia sichuanensis E412]